jgi:hypothetical protein
MFALVDPAGAERGGSRAGDEVEPVAHVVMDRAFTVTGAPEQVWPWIAQLGKRRAGWYLSRRVERFIPTRRRASTHIDPRWQQIAVGDAIPDWGGGNETLTVAQVDPPSILVCTSQRRTTRLSWSITLRPLSESADAERTRDPAARPRLAQTRVLLRLRLGPVKHVWLAGHPGANAASTRSWWWKSLPRPGVAPKTVFDVFVSKERLFLDVVESVVSTTSSGGRDAGQEVECPSSWPKR